MAKDLAG